MNSFDDEQVLAYLSGECEGLGPAPAELDDLRALLADPTTWEEPPPGLADGVVAAVAVAASTAPRPVPAPWAEPAPVVPLAPKRVSRLRPAGFAAAAVAASVALGTVIGANLNDGAGTPPALAAAAAAQTGAVPAAGLPSVAVTAQEKEQFTQADLRELDDPAGSVGFGPSLGRFPGVLYWLTEGPGGSSLLAREIAQIYDRNGRATGALRAMLNRRPADPDARNPWPAGSSGDVDLSSVAGGVGTAYPAGTAVVYLNSAALTGRASADEARAAVQQVVWTLRANDPSITRVVISALAAKDRTALEKRGLWSSGVGFAEPVLPGEAGAVLAPVQIDAPAEAARLEAGTFTVSGAAISPNGRIRWEVLDRGQVVRRGEATTAACCSLSPYSFDLALAPGTYTIVVYPSLDGPTGSASRTVEVSGTVA
ncbi:MAG: Gmad2 immunoglobulin-like domain-containing protein [Sporichthyaceae bacterium]